MSPAHILLLTAAAASQDGEARCEIRGGDLVWRGPCRIEPAPPSGVTIGWVPGYRFPFGWSGIFVTSDDGRRGRLRVHIAFGDDVDLGPVRRSPRQGCWIGATYRICIAPRP